VAEQQHPQQQVQAVQQQEQQQQQEQEQQQQGPEPMPQTFALSELEELRRVAASQIYVPVNPKFWSVPALMNMATYSKVSGGLSNARSIAAHCGGIRTLCAAMW
jgi:hypothetical protein